MRDDHQAMRAAARGGFIVILRNESRDGLREFVAESRPVGRRPEANLGIHGQGRQAFARLCRTTNKVAHLADDPWPTAMRKLADSLSISRLGSAPTGPRAPGETT
jgi:hypothetical protein